MLKKIFRPLYRIFLWSSGAHLETLDKVPIEKSKYFGIGGTIIFTALMASFAGGYAFFTAFKNPLSSVFFGLFWGALIYNLDRYIVSTFGVGDGKKTISRQELLEAAPRLVMAIILGFVISTPLELKIFESEIQTKVERLKIEKRLELMSTDSVFHTDLESKRIRLTEIENEISELRKSKEQRVHNDVSFMDSRKKDFTSDLTQKEGELKIAQNKVNYAYRKYIAAKEDTTGLYTTEQINSLNSTYRNAFSARNTLISERQALEEKITNLEEDKYSEQRKISSDIDNTIESRTTEKSILVEQIASMEQTKNDKTVNYENVAENYDGFAAHLEALSVLTDEKPIIKIAKWFITLLFVFIEIAPIMFKMMTERGPYDDMMDKAKHDIKVKELLAISNINEEINTLVKLNREQNLQKLNAELAANENLLQTIADAQAEIAKKAIEEWKRRQVELVVANPEILIKDNLKEHV
ncbi:DUF4407 domain-containing protein [uncultured Draconibacterium sp.]|uniref:DUF4407 domain-containing protein n=1 Tax=uncultured Draconibacterium sp. TaxID=1573823 RepID=UPI0032168E95